MKVTSLAPASLPPPHAAAVRASAASAVAHEIAALGMMVRPR